MVGGELENRAKRGRPPSTFPPLSEPVSPSTDFILVPGDRRPPLEAFREHSLVTMFHWGDIIRTVGDSEGEKEGQWKCHTQVSARHQPRRGRNH